MGGESVPETWEPNTPHQSQPASSSPLRPAGKAPRLSFQTMLPKCLQGPQGDLSRKLSCTHSLPVAPALHPRRPLQAGLCL